MRKQMFLTITMAIMGVGASVASTAHADPYGTAGCGLGSMLFHDKPGIVQVLAATTNGTFGTQTFGISSGTSNCEDTKASAQSTKSFVQANREAVSKDIARGSGETISSVSTLAGCANPAAVGQHAAARVQDHLPEREGHRRRGQRFGGRHAARASRARLPRALLIS